MYIDDEALMGQSALVQWNESKVLDEKVDVIEEPSGGSAAGVRIEKIKNKMS